MYGRDRVTDVSNPRAIWRQLASLIRDVSINDATRLADRTQWCNGSYTVEMFPRLYIDESVKTLRVEKSYQKPYQSLEWCK